MANDDVQQNDDTTTTSNGTGTMIANPRRVRWSVDRD